MHVSITDDDRENTERTSSRHSFFAYSFSAHEGKGRSRLSHTHVGSSQFEMKRTLLLAACFRLPHAS